MGPCADMSLSAVVTGRICRIFGVGKKLQHVWFSLSPNGADLGQISFRKATDVCGYTSNTLSQWRVVLVEDRWLWLSSLVLSLSLLKMNMLNSEVRGILYMSYLVAGNTSLD